MYAPSENGSFSKFVVAKNKLRNMFSPTNQMRAHEKTSIACCAVTSHSELLSLLAKARPVAYSLPTAPCSITPSAVQPAHACGVATPTVKKLVFTE